MTGVDELKLKIISLAKLEDLVTEVTPGKRHGGRLFALCPFHEEKTGSFTVFEGRRYYCFGCKANGDAIDFVRKTKSLGFIETLRYLADRYQIDASCLDQSRASNDFQNRAKIYFNAMQVASRHFQDNLKSPDGNQARQYLEERGLTPQTIATFGIGLAKDSFDDLSKTLRQYKIPVDIAETLSLVRQRPERGGSYDFFRSRLMVPICDTSGRTIAFGGRDLTDKGPKYLNSSETPIYHKRKSLFAMHLAQAEMRKKKRAIVVEGYMDAIQLWQAGFQETVACLGTALTVDQIKLISPHAQQIYIIFDGDAAGRRAALSTLDSALEFPHLHFRSVILPSTEDPDSLVKKGGPMALQELIDKALPLFDMALKSQLQSVENAGIPGLLKTGVLQWINKIEDPLRKGFLLTKTAEFTALPLSLLEEALKQGSVATQINSDKMTPPPKPSSLTTAERKKLSKFEYEMLGHLYFADPEQLNFALVEALFASQFQENFAWQPLITELLKNLKSGRKPADLALSDLVTTQENDICKLIEDFQQKRRAFLSEGSQQNQAFEKLAANLKRQEMNSNIDMLKRALNQALNTPDEAQVLKEILELTHKIRDIDLSLR